MKPKIAQGRTLGSRARYVLHVETIGDDYADNMEDASPVSALGFMPGKIHSDDDFDRFYLTVFDQAQVAYRMTRYSGTLGVVLMDQAGIWLSICGLDSNHPSCVDTLDLPKGTYYLAVAGSSGAAYKVDYFLATYPTEPGTTRGTAINLYDPNIPTPLPSRAITNRFQTSSKHYYRFWARRNEIFMFNLFGTARISVSRDVNNNTEYQRLVNNAPDPDGKERTDSWGTLLEDAFAGVSSPNFLRHSSYLSFVAPWEGWYHLIIEKEGIESNYGFWAPNGLVWLDEPDDP